jgi:hypothetical protein
VLTLGNFYQTEKDNEFCCETCPDEELKTKRSKVDESNRLSIAQRIALFEKTETSSVLKKSLSDEEKSKSLSRQLPSAAANSQALNSFLSSQIVDNEEEEEEKTLESLSSDSESDDDAPATKSDHKNSINDGSGVIPTKELTHDDNSTAHTHNNESQQQLKHVDSDAILDSSSENVNDDIELEFERLAEEAVNNPVAIPPLPVSPTAAKPSEEKSIKVEVEEEKEPQVTVEEVRDVVVKEVVERPQTPMMEEEEEVAVGQADTTQEAKAEEIDVKPEVLKEPEAVDDSNASEKQLYPGDLNPFGEDEEQSKKPAEGEAAKRPSLNPFGSCSEDEEDNNTANCRNSVTGTLHKQKPPRPPLPRTAMTLKPASTNPFGSDDDDEEPSTQIANKTPVPTPRKPL